MDLRRSKRVSKPKIPWEERAVSSAASNAKLIEKTAKTKHGTTLKPPTIGRIPETIEIDVNEQIEMNEDSDSIETH
ncbi:hypothetical protein GJ744_000407 [Endocarpon pusillum]|uniref:Uncharacterized protein n=1 Tax=Endocarpon pusillum TaxID=364733 RepID=A0A8H7ADM3_9EURO|nr:hypothetical protein GJ744_000407 [Endocarpon pusillum]